LRDEFFEKMRRELEEKEMRREEIILKARELRLLSSKAIANIHSGKIDKCKKYLERAEEILKDVLDYRISSPDLFYLFNDSIQEFVEAYVFLNVVERKELPESLPVDIPNAVLPGLADSIGEIRRYILSEMLRGGDFDEIKKVLELMEKLYFILIEFDFHDRLTGNLRQKLDQARNSIDRTKSDFISARLIVTGRR